jgi:CheY-like chemotaxis protein
MATLVFCEDDPTIRKLIAVALRALSHEIHLAEDGQAGLALIERVRPDVVFADVSMPRLDGLQLCAALKARPEFADIPFVLVTASVQRAQIEEGLRHGAVAHLAKPFSTAELRAVVERFARALDR